MRSWTSFVVAGAAVAAGAAVGLYVFLRRQRPLALPAPPAATLGDSTSDEPISRETRYDEEIDEEERRRHEAAERLRADPLNERLNGDTET